MTLITHWYYKSTGKQSDDRVGCLCLFTYNKGKMAWRSSHWILHP
ncbi:hypothetical protein DOT_1149 [Desulfosporosinus sp. OT]|nr:hypothetical protein DOT_1149 [Desulfosporosinus sp. OT]